MARQEGTLEEMRREIEELRKRLEDDEARALVRAMFSTHGEVAGPGEEEEAEAGPTRRRGIGDRIAGACDSLWGGPVAPHEDDTILSWFSTFCSGVTTAHGINRVFDDGQGPLRRAFWLLFFFAAFVVVWYLVNNAVLRFMRADVATTIATEEGSSTMPMVTVCNSSPLRCACEAFYDPIMVDQHFDLVLPYVCAGVIAYKSTFSGSVDASTGKRPADRPVLEELATSEVDREQTKINMAAFASDPANLIQCSNGAYTKDSFMAMIVQKGTLTTLDLINYAGYVDRRSLLRFCMAPDAMTGEAVNCDDDAFWSPPEISEDLGACHTFNPCHGFEDRIGKDCMTDTDCEHASYHEETVLTRLHGGTCKSGKCACTACAAEEGCKIVKQWQTGKGHGPRLALNVPVDEDAAVYSAQQSRWTSGAAVFLHSRLDDMNAGARLLAPPGMSTDVSIGQEISAETNFPYTNCSRISITDGLLCKKNCLRSVQAQECCGRSAATSNITLGRFDTFTQEVFEGARISYRNPVLACNLLDPDLASCLNDKAKKTTKNEICLEGATLMEQGYSKLIFSQSKTGWYDTADNDGNGVPDQEERSARIERQCVWKEDSRLLPSGLEEPKHGSECTGDADCVSLSGETDRIGKCQTAYRAFCPEPCDYLRYSTRSLGSYPLSSAAVAIMASQELGYATSLNQDTPDPTGIWKPRCQRDSNTALYIDDASCFTDIEAQQVVRENYAMLNLYYEDFGQTVVTRSAAIDVDVLVGTIGGNLGLCVGFSIMTIIEWIELGAFAVLSVPFFYFGIKMPFVRRKNNTEEMPIDVIDQDVATVLKNVKKIYVEKKAESQPDNKASITVIADLVLAQPVAGGDTPAEDNTPPTREPPPLPERPAHSEA